MDVSKTGDHIQMRIKMLNPCQYPPASSKSSNQDLKDMDFLGTFKIKMDSLHSEHGRMKTSDHIQIKIKMQNPRQEPPASCKASMRTYRTQIESQNSDHWCIKDQWPYYNQYQDAKSQSGTSSVLQSPKSGLKGHGCSLHLQNQNRILKFGTRVYQRPVPMSKWRSRCLTPFRILQHPAKPHIRTRRTWMFFAPSKL